MSHGTLGNSGTKIGEQWDKSVPEFMQVFGYNLLAREPDEFQKSDVETDASNVQSPIQFY